MADPILESLANRIKNQLPAEVFARGFSQRIGRPVDIIEEGIKGVNLLDKHLCILIRYIKVKTVEPVTGLENTAVFHANYLWTNQKEFSNITDIPGSAYN